MSSTQRTGSSPLIVVLLAATGGFVGWFVLGGWMAGTTTFFYVEGIVALGVVVAGWGWLAGAAVGLTLLRPAPARWWESVALVAIAAVFLFAGATFNWWSIEIEARPPSIHHLRFEALGLAIRLDSLVAAATCISLTQRSRRVLMVGGVVAVGIAAASTVAFFAGPCSLQTRCPGPKI